VVAVVVAVALAVFVNGSTPTASAQNLFGLTTTTRPASTTTLDITQVPVQPGRVAYVTPGGDVVVAQSDGSQPLIVGHGAVQTTSGLAPLAWSPDGGKVAYVRNDGALVLASSDNSAFPETVATDAVVSQFATENLLSFVVSGQAISYLRAAPGGRSIAAVTFFDGQNKGKTINLTDPATRVPTAFQFSPLDPYLYLQSADVETLKDFTTAVVDPIQATPFSTPYSVDDPAFAPDSAYAYGVVSVGGSQQLVRVDAVTADFVALRDQDRICKPTPSPDGTKLVYGAGPNCGEIWTINSDGSNPHEVASSVGGAASFADGDFSWSLDGKVVSHAACRGLQQGASCGGAYWDIPINGKGITARADAASVRREYRPLIKPIKAFVDVTGPFEYTTRMLLSAAVVSPLLQRIPTGQAATAQGVDVTDPNRRIAIKFLQSVDNRFLMGTIQIADQKAKVNRTFTVLGAITIQSYRYASLRGIWLKTSSMPFQSGRIDVTLYR
jgi:hypothetical protein